ncbi:hypothetical protein HMPREF9630_00825 [Peptoanaerobacter stomatis]|uniref:Double-GTPase 2 domain-containing protein n=1 Tax=Peptoanaerobacter stomatis TaxID=796937 RepID=V9HNQ5_9FIRM|nr:topoisomerase DNA-binding C4 zinc finger domain-containing protein [Peptoanaerobacter stomatis]EHL14782.1 hypothetical protein HMPREF9630_00825 [Peptoanaerobacter stomatis]
MKKDTQPAKKSYFFGPGWNDLGKFIKRFWQFNQDDIKKKAEKIETGKGIMSFSGARALMSCISLILFGTIFFCLIAATVSTVLGVAFCFVYILILAIWLLDRINLISKGIFVACPNCKSKYLIPTYICPSCGEKHTKLTPGKYGVFFRTCNCGKKLPSHFLTKRGSLAAECPKCGVSLSGTATKPLCIPIIGGRSSGKTAYINAFSYEFIEKVAPRNGIEIKHYNEETERFYNHDISNDYMGGTTRMTKTEMDLKQASSKAFSFIIHHNKISPDRLVQIYDVAGESFVDNTENEEQLQYTYCQGIVFMLDPLSIPMVRNHLDDTISEIDRSSVGTLDVDLVLDSFLNKIRQITGQSSTAVFNMPIAIVISKGDIRTLDRFIGDEKISEYMTENNLDMDSFTVAEDELCRKFLMENGLASFVSNIDLKFKNNRYFKCSSIGHTREVGRYNPRGVLEPMEWIFQTADSGMKSIWHENKFGNIKRGDE